MKITFLRTCKVYGQHMEVGQTDDVDDKLAGELVALGKAELYGEKPKEEALEPPPLPGKNRKWLSKKGAGAALVPGASEGEKE